MRAPPITAIMVTYQSKAVIDEALEHLRSANQIGLLNCVVVDNASSDGTPQLIEEHHPWVKLVYSAKNLGYGRGLNLGTEYANSPYVLFMNPDVVLDADNCRILLDFIEKRPKAGIVAPAIIESNGEYQVAGKLPTPWGLVFAAAGINFGAKRRPILPNDAPFKTDWLCGALLLARKNLIDELRGFDPRFFLYFEETDLCLRALKAGAQLWAVGAAKATHVSGASARSLSEELFGGCIMEHYFRSRYYYLVKHHGRVAASLAEIGELSLMGSLELLSRLRRRRGKTFATRLRAPILKMPAKIL